MHLKITTIKTINFYTIYSAELVHHPDRGKLLKVIYPSGKETFFDKSFGFIQIISGATILMEIGSMEITKKDAYILFETETKENATYKHHGVNTEKKNYLDWIDQIFFTIIEEKGGEI